MLLEKVTTPRLASPPLQGCAVIFLFSLCERSPLPELSSPTPYGWARSQARGSKGRLGEWWSPAPPAGAVVGGLGLLAAFLQCPARPCPPCPAMWLRPKCHLCPQLPGGTVSRHSGCSLWQPWDMVGCFPCERKGVWFRGGCKAAVVH